MQGFLGFELRQLTKEHNAIKVIVTNRCQHGCFNRGGQGDGARVSVRPAVNLPTLARDAAWAFQCVVRVAGDLEKVMQGSCTSCGAWYK